MYWVGDKDTDPICPNFSGTCQHLVSQSSQFLAGVNARECATLGMKFVFPKFNTLLIEAREELLFGSICLKKRNLGYTELPLGFSAFMVNSGGAQMTRSSSVPNFQRTKVTWHESQ